ncbi:unnamed protein product [Protopolystoma xenopodis]|uniref:Uncharacterized protein n=1 Tax=Protopolystoma xenopodis TaxID=117903 RepID=A0A3S5ANT4_9PLAT|nr:unnamed protein product [Protopolystoma xenopodis]
MSLFCGPLVRLERAFRLASDHLGIPILVEPRQLLEPSTWSDERCMLTILVTWYHRMTRVQAHRKQADRLGGVIGRALAIRRRIGTFSRRLHRWLCWLRHEGNRLDRLIATKGAHIGRNKDEQICDNSRGDVAISETCRKLQMTGYDTKELEKLTIGEEMRSIRLRFQELSSWRRKEVFAQLVEKGQIEVRNDLMGLFILYHFIY